MSDKKRNKFRANVRPFVDSDYKDKLSSEELAYLDQFENEYYSNALNREGSIHRTSLSSSDFQRCKKETFDATNSQNRDQYAISATSSNYLKHVDDENCFIEIIAPTTNPSKFIDPQKAMDTLLEETLDELNSEKSRDTIIILRELAIESCRLGFSLKPDKVKKSLKKQKVTKENKDE